MNSVRVNLKEPYSIPRDSFGKKLRGPFTCQRLECSHSFFSRKQHAKFCSKSCRAKVAKPAQYTCEYRNHCLRCGKQIKIGDKRCTLCHRIHLLNVTKEKQAAKRCVLCGQPLRLARGSNYNKYCIDCRQIQNGILKYGNEWEPVDRIAVFERDNWHCGICGIETPRSLCGTGLPNEPTLEHILPQVLGGAHSYKNCGLSCRDCNSKKRDKIELEPRLKGVTDYSPYKVAKFRAQQQDQQQALCACGCGEYFTPKLGNKTGCKHGHWYMTEEGQRHIAEMMTDSSKVLARVQFVSKPYVPLEVDPNSRLGKLQKAMHERQERLQSKAVEQSTAKHRQPIKRARTAAQMRVADHTALYQSGLCASEFIKQSLLSPLPS